MLGFAPGIDLASLDVTIGRNVLKIAGDRNSGLPSRDGKTQRDAQERPEGRFSPAVSLPHDVDTMKVDAKYRDGRPSRQRCPECHRAAAAHRGAVIDRPVN